MSESYSLEPVIMLGYPGVILMEGGGRNVRAGERFEGATEEDGGGATD